MPGTVTGASRAFVAECCTSCVVWPPHGKISCRAPVHDRAGAACWRHQLVRSRRDFRAKAGAVLRGFAESKTARNSVVVTVVVEQAAKMTQYQRLRAAHTGG